MPRVLQTDAVVRSMPLAACGLCTTATAVLFWLDCDQYS